MKKVTRPNTNNKATAKTQATAKPETKKTPATATTKSETPKKEKKNTVEIRKAFYEGFKKGFDTKTCYCKADTDMADVKDTSWKDEYQYLHIFKEGKKSQLFYLQFTGNKLYFVVGDNEAVKKVDKSRTEAITLIQPIIQVTKLKKPLEEETEYKHFLTSEQAQRFTDNIPRAAIQKGAQIFCVPDVKNAVEVARLIRNILTEV